MNDGNLSAAGTTTHGGPSAGHWCALNICTTAGTASEPVVGQWPYGIWSASMSSQLELFFAQACHGACAEPI
jgi:hypothetical protein